MEGYTRPSVKIVEARAPEEPEIGRPTLPPFIPIEDLTPAWLSARVVLESILLPRYVAGFHADPDNGNRTAMIASCWRDNVSPVFFAPPEDKQAIFELCVVADNAIATYVGKEMEALTARFLHCNATPSVLCEINYTLEMFERQLESGLMPTPRDVVAHCMGLRPCPLGSYQLCKTESSS